MINNLELSNYIPKSIILYSIILYSDIILESVVYKDNTLSNISYYLEFLIQYLNKDKGASN